ncbi:MAG: hypothetical protein ACE5NG_10135 [bacterium]
MRVVECWNVDTGQLGPPGYEPIRWVENSTGRVLQTVILADNFHVTRTIGEV